MSTEEQGSNTPELGASGSNWPSLSEVTPYQVARLAVELSKIPEVVTEKSWGDRTRLAINLLELAKEQLADRTRSPLKDFPNEPLEDWREKQALLATRLSEIRSEQTWRERSDTPLVPFAKAAKQITGSQRRGQAINHLRLFLSTLNRFDSLPNFLRQDAELWLISASVPQGYIEFLKRLYVNWFKKFYPSALAKVKGQKGGKAKAEKKGKSQLSG